MMIIITVKKLSTTAIMSLLLFVMMNDVYFDSRDGTVRQIEALGGNADDDNDNDADENDHKI